MISEDFSGLVDTNEADGPRARLGGLDVVRKERAVEDRREEAEARLADRLWADLTAALLSDPPPPLRAIVNQLQVPRLRHDSAPERPEPERLSARRLLEQIFVQTAFYLPRDFAAKHDFLRAELAIRLAAELKPDRAGVAWYNLACFRATAGDRKGALDSLKSAVKNGYRDVEVIEGDPDLVSLHGENGYRAIVTELKARPTS